MRAKGFLNYQFLILRLPLYLSKITIIGYYFKIYSFSTSNQALTGDQGNVRWRLARKEE